MRFFTKTLWLVTLAIGIVSSNYVEAEETLGVTRAPKSSVIPEKREFPVNEEINPCVDFYQYACSKVNESFQLPEDRSIHNFLLMTLASVY